MTTDTRHVLHRMSEEIERVVEAATFVTNPDGENERRSPPVVYVTFEVDGEEHTLNWVGIRVVQVEHGGDTERDATAEAIVDAEAYLERQDTYDKGLDIRIADDAASPETVTDVTERLLAEVFGRDFDADVDLKWEDYDNSEFLDGDSFLNEYGHD